MKMRCFVLSFLLFGLSILVLSAQGQKKGSQKSAVFKGELLQKPWTKSTQSYCARGSDYFVLKNDSLEIVLENQTNQELKKFHQQKVQIIGFIQKRVIKSSDNPMEQRPVETDINGNEIKQDFTCEVLVIRKIKLIR